MNDSAAPRSLRACQPDPAVQVATKNPAVRSVRFAAAASNDRENRSTALRTPLTRKNLPDNAVAPLGPVDSKAVNSSGSTLPPSSRVAVAETLYAPRPALISPWARGFGPWIGFGVHAMSENPPPKRIPVGGAAAAFTDTASVQPPHSALQARTL